MEETTCELTKQIKCVDDLLTSEGLEAVKSDEQQTKKKKPSRKRPRTNAIRLDLKNRLEAAILSSESDVRAILQTRGDDGILRAPLLEVLDRLRLLDNPQFANLSTFALKSISNVTRVFKITEKAPNIHPGREEHQRTHANDPILFSTPALADLWICVEPRICAHSDEKTVYVDNLPPQCSEAKLRRRAVVFGSVAKVFLPQIPRIQRHIGSTLNSGFGFVQFVSKTAAKRFCKRYAASSRLKRAKHSGYHHKKKSSGALANQNGTNVMDGSGGDITMEESFVDDYDGNTVVDRGSSLDLASILEFDYASRRAVEEEIRKEKEEEHAFQSEESDKTSGRKREASAALSYETKKSPISGGLAQVIGPLPKRRRSDTDDDKLVSVTATTSEHGQTTKSSSSVKCKNEMDKEGADIFVEATAENESRSRNLSMSMYDSGNDTETENPLLAKRQSQNLDTGTAGKDAENKRRRKRRRRSPSVGGHGGGSLTNMLRRIQVFSLKQYRELRAEYLKLKKERVAALKQQISQTDVGETGLSDSINDKANICNNGEEARQMRQRNRRRRPGGGRARIFKKAEGIKGVDFLD